MSDERGLTYFKEWGFSINEGAGPVNVHASWYAGLFVYVYFFGLRWHKHWKRA